MLISQTAASCGTHSISPWLPIADSESERLASPTHRVPGWQEASDRLPRDCHGIRERPWQTVIVYLAEFNWRRFTTVWAHTDEMARASW